MTCVEPGIRAANVLDQKLEAQNRKIAAGQRHLARPISVGEEIWLGTLCELIQGMLGEFWR